jgi:hypothetical protein
MEKVMRANALEDVPAIIKGGDVEKVLLGQRELIQKGIPQEEGSAKIPTTGMLWRELDATKIRSWIYEHRLDLWAMFYGKLPVPEHGASCLP